MIRVGIVGMGMMGRTHFEAYETFPNAKVVAICDINPARAAGDLAGTGGNVLQGGITHLPMDRIQGYQNHHDLLKSDVDVVDVCVPTPVHPEIALDAIKANKHVLCEKPLARTLADARKIVDAANASPKFFMPAMCIRFWPEWAWLKKTIEQKTYGKVLSATFRRRTSLPAGWFGDGKQSGGALLDLHIHDSDFVNFLFGKPQAVYSRGYTKHTGEIDHLITHYHYKDVPLVMAEGTWALSAGYGFAMRYTVNFENATADYDLARPQVLQVYQEGKTTAIQCPGGTGYTVELAYFVDCVSKGQKPSIVTANDALTSLTICDAENRSIQSGQLVPV